jgi:hypothetical protein
VNRWWGEPWPRADYRASVCEDDAFRVPTPVGERCMQCDEEIGPDDRGVMYPGYLDVDGWKPTSLYSHIECNIRSVIGCSANLRGEPHDHSVSYREDALRVQEWLDQNPSF